MKKKPVKLRNYTIRLEQVQIEKLREFLSNHTGIEITVSNAIRSSIDFMIEHYEELK